MRVALRLSLLNLRSVAALPALLAKFTKAASLKENLRRRLIQARRDAKIATDTKYFARRRDGAKRNLRASSKGICGEILNLR